MATTLRYVSQLASQTASAVTQDVESWKKYLTTTSRLYKYAYDDQLLIYAQRPDAVACADMELWNNTMHRWVKARSTGIAVIRKDGGRPHLEYLFDYSDTRPVRGAREPYLWQLREEHQSAVLAALEQQCGSLEENDLGEQLMEAARRMVRETYRDHLTDLAYDAKDSFLEELDELNLEVRFRNLLTASVQFTLLTRCGLDPSEYLEDEDLAGIMEFSTSAVLHHLGSAASDVSKELLVGIERAVKAHDREKLRESKNISEKPLAKSTPERYTTSTDRFNTLKHESGERSDTDGGADLPEDGRLPDSRPDAGRGGRNGGDAPGQVRDAAGDLLAGTPQRDVHLDAADGPAGTPPAGDRPAGTGAGGPDGSPAQDAEGRDRGAEGQGPDGLGTGGEQLSGTGRGTGAGGDRLQVNLEENETAGGEPAVSASAEGPKVPFQLFPTVEEQVERIAEAQVEAVQLSMDAPASTVPDAVIGRALTSAGNSRHSAERIVAFFQKDPTGSAATSFLEKEYGTGGKGLFIGGKEYAVWFNTEGFHIAPGRTAFGPGEVTVPWVQVAAWIGRLLQDGQYASQRVIDNARENEYQELAQALWFLRQDFSDEAIRQGYLPTVNKEYIGSNAPESELKIAEVLRDAQARHKLVGELNKFTAAFAKDASLLRFRPSTPPGELLQKVSMLDRPVTQFQAVQDFAPASGNFITEDELDRLILRGSGVSQGKLRIYSYFMQGHNASECVRFLRDEYGIGGLSYTGFDEWHDGKGIKLSREDDFSQGDYDTVRLSWNQVEKRIRGFVQNGRYLNEKEQAFLPEYEKDYLARCIVQFYDYHPDISTPYAKEAEAGAAAKAVRQLLDDPTAVSKLTDAMLSDFAAVPPDTRGYHTMRVALRDISAFARGASPLFDPLPEKALQAERELEQARKDAGAQERKAGKKEKAALEQEPAAGTLAAAARALSRKQKPQPVEMGGEQLSLDMFLQPEPPKEPEAQEAPSKPEVEKAQPRKKVVVEVIRSPDLEREYQDRLGQEAATAAAEPPTVSYDLGYGHTGSGLNVWNRLEQVNGDYKTIAHIHPNREVVFYDDHLPEEVKEQIRQVAATSEMTVSATQDTPVFSTPPQAREESRAPWWDEYNSIKEAHPDSIVLYQVGDFYEMYGEDAKVAAPLLGISLHTRPIAGAGRVEFCGVPVYALEQYVERLRSRHDLVLVPVDEQTRERRTYPMPSMDHETPEDSGQQEADAHASDYRLLSRLKADCEYFLGAGQGAEKHLWAGSVPAQIAKMRELYASLPEKPEWLTEQDIDRYAQRMADFGREADTPAPAAEALADGPALYREALALADRALRENVVYSYLRDRDTDYDSAREELGVAIDEYMESLEDQRPMLVQAYHTLPLFRDWLLEDLLERYYQDVTIDPRDSVEKHAEEADAPDWIRGNAVEPAPVPPEQEAPVEEATAPVEQPGPGAPQADETPEPSLAPNVEEYLNLKAQHPDKAIGVRVGDYLLFYGKDAETAAPALGTKILTQDIDGLGTTTVTGSNLAWQAVLNELMEHGVSVVLAEQDPERGPEAPYQVIKERDASDYIPIGMELTVQGRRMKVHSVNYDSGTVDLQDLELRGWYPIFRTESVPFVRQFVEDTQQRELEGQAQEPLAGSALDRAKDLIQQFYEKEYGDEVEADFSDLTKVNLAYTTTEDERHEIQVTADLEACTVTKSVDGVPAEKTAYPGLDELIDHELRDMTFDELVYLEKDPSRVLEPVSMDGGKVSDYTTKTVGTVNAGAFDVVFQELRTGPERHNFRITDDNLGVGGQKTKYQNNVAAIRTLKQIEAEGRLATPEEQEALSRYVGWGSMAQAFDPDNKKWSKEYAELKELLTPKEYESARSTVLNAHYTNPTVIKAMYQAVERMGLRPGNILEPSCGIGNFFGLLPDGMQDAKLYGVELDSLTGRIAKQLYQKADITVDGFENTDYPDDFFDLAMGNVPFGEYKVHDRRYDRQNLLIHDYFITKALDKVRPGGVVAFITTKGTMDKQNSKVRQDLAQKADLLGAIRLPNNAFKANAGTEVTTDILFFQKRASAPEKLPEWVQAGQTEDGVPLNSYFLQHPEMVLGTMSFWKNMYGNETETACLPIQGADLKEHLAEAITHIAQPDRELLAMDAQGQDGKGEESIPADPSARNFSFVLSKGQIYFRENSRMKRVELGKTPTARVKGMVAIRDSARKIIDLQLNGAGDDELQAEQANLSRLYDAFTKKYGLLNSAGNRLAFAQDSSYPLLCSLEVLDDEGNLKRKADMFTKRTILHHEPVTSVDTAAEALAVSIGERACVDLQYMAGLMGGPEKIPQIVADLQGVIYKDPATGPFDMEAGGNGWSRGWQTADEYLSGNVREKLAQARAAAEEYPEFARNVESLEQVQPKELTAAEIEVRVGVDWIDPKYYQQFLFELLQVPAHLQNGKIQVRYDKRTGEWNIQGKREDRRDSARVYATYGTKRRSAYQIFEDALNQRDTRVYDTHADGTRVLNQKDTTIAQQKQEAICQAFKDWIFKDPERRAEVCATYNRIFNSTRPREYNGDHIRFTGMNPEIKLEPHQRNAVARMLYGGNTLLAHCVGAGKTFEMTAAAMEAKRLGLCKKSLFVVPNHLTEQWGGDFLTLYPGAKVLVATKKDFEPKNRRKFCARIATGDYDAVIIGHSQFEKIPLSPERQEAAIQNQLDEILEAIDEAKREKAENFTVKQMEKTRKNLEAKLKRLHDKKKDDVVTFEELGVDRLFVDEAHYYKNLYLFTKMRNVAGISQTEAQKSSDMFAKCRYLDEITGGRGVTFATGTPVSNSMVELYTMMRYLQYDMLESLGLTHFDSWAAAFGEKVTAVELKPEGTGFRAKTRFARFYNLPELINLWKEAADIQTAEMLNLPVPKAEYITISTEPSKAQQEMVEGLAERAEIVRSGGVDPSQDNMLKITNDGRKLALDQRLMNPLLPDNPEGKVNACVNNVFQIWQASAENRGAQLVFCDLSTPKGKSSEPKPQAKEEDGQPEEAAEDAEGIRMEMSVYQDIRAKLIAKGIPAEEIAFIHDAHTDAQKAELFAKVRAGQVRVLLGSTAKMGAGTNVQTRLVSSHDLDCPWRPADLEQRAGRIVRRGNENESVCIYRYVTKGTFDAYNWGLVENKQKFIGQLMSGKSPARSIEDVDATALSYAEVKMLATGDPRIKEKMDLDIQVAKLKLLKSNHMAMKYEMEDKVLKYYPAKMAETRMFIRALGEDQAIRDLHPVKEDSFAMTIQGQTYTERKKAGEAIIAACQNMADPEKPVELGEYRGFPMTLKFIKGTFQVVLKQNLSYTAELGEDVLGNITRINHALEKIPENLEAQKRFLTTLEGELVNAKEEAARDFPQEQELAEKSARLAELNAELDKAERSKKKPAREESEQEAPPAEKPSIRQQLKDYAAPARADAGTERAPWRGPVR